MRELFAVFFFVFSSYISTSKTMVFPKYDLDLIDASGNPPPKIQYQFVKVTEIDKPPSHKYISTNPIDPLIIRDYEASPTPSGVWVFYIRPPGTSPPGPARWIFFTKELKIRNTRISKLSGEYHAPAAGDNAYIKTGRISRSLQFEN